METCPALIPSPGSDDGEEQCQLPVGHDGPHQYTQDNQWRSLTITWEDKPQPPPTPEELAVREAFRARYVTSTRYGIQTLLTRAVADKLKNTTLRLPE
jgi:hypothetical protein